MDRIAALGKEFVEQVLLAVQGMLLNAVPKSLSEMERGVRQTLLQTGRFLLASWIALQEGPSLPDEIACRCGGMAHYEGKREGVLFTIVGTVRYKRAYYLCSQCHKGMHPLDERLGLRPGEISAELESLLGMVGAQSPFEKGSEIFERLTLVHISPQSMDDATEVMGQEVARMEDEWKAASQDLEALNAQERDKKSDLRLYGSLDAVKYHDRERRGEGDEGWHDLKVGVWFETDAPPPNKPDEGWEVRAQNITYYCDILEADKFGELVWATGVQRKALQAGELIFLGDGADWIWNLVDERYPQAVQIVDWFHAAEHLGGVAKAAYPEGEERDKWLSQIKDHLWTGHVDQVVADLRALEEQGRGGDEPRKAAGYFEKHRRRMDYATFRGKGYQIGSGSIESGCKQMGIQRMKVPGATWSTSGARYTAKARAAFLSGQWDDLTQRRQHLSRAA